MPMDTENIKKALDHFENDEFVDSKEILTREIKKAKNDFLKNTLDLSKDIEPQPEVQPEDEE